MLIFIEIHCKKENNRNSSVKQLKESFGSSTINPTMSQNNSQKILADLFQSASDSEDTNSIPAAQERNQPASSQKRKISTDCEPTNCKQIKIMLPEDFDQVLDDLDPGKSLSVHDLKSESGNDILVSEYANLFCKLKLLPTIPKQEELEQWISHPTDMDITTDASIKLVKNFMSLFQSKYFQNNITAAQVNHAHVINPSVKMSVPNFQLLPDLFFKKIHTMKESFAMQYEGLAVEGSQFTSELLVLRNLNLIYTELTEKLDSESHIHPVVLKIFATHYLKSKMEFAQQFHIKNIDWKNRESKVNYMQPKWRKENQEPPTEAFNFYAKIITKRIEEGKEKFQASSVISEYKEFMQKGESSLQKAKNRFSAQKQTSNHSQNPASNSQHKTTAANSSHRNTPRKYKKANKPSDRKQEFSPQMKNRSAFQENTATLEESLSKLE